MSDTEHDATEHEKEEPEGSLDLNFVPDWARKPPAPTRWQDDAPRRGGRDDFRQGRRGGRDDRGGGGRDSRRPRPPRRDQRDDRSRPSPSGGFNAGQAPRPPMRDQGPQGQGPRAQAPRAQTPQGQGPRDQGPRDQGPRGGQGNQRHGQRRYREQRPPRLPLDIRIIPDQQGVQAVARRVHHTWMAYPVMDLATIFLTKPELTHIRLEVPRGVEDLALHQCKVCSAVSLDAEAALAHAISTHMEELYEKEDTLAEAPTGSFVVVARCGLSGELLGPPNHHSYAQRVQEVHDNRYPSMDMESYRRRIETVRDAEVIEQWKEESRKQTVYRLKEVPEGEEAVELDRNAAIAAFRADVAPGMIRKTRKTSVPAAVALHMDAGRLRAEIRQMWEDEERFPLKISFALRAAFKHMHLHVFKAGQGVHFVTRVEPGALNPEHVVEGIREVLLFLHDHPGSTRSQMVEELRPGSAMDSEAAHDVVAPLSWLIERGHIIEFFNGTLAVPLKQRSTRPARPKGPPHRRRGKKNA